MHPHQRLRRAREFERVRQQGRTYRSPLLLLGVAPALEPHRPTARCGLLVSRRLGKAVVRNKIRRRLREIMRRTLPLVAPEWDLVLIARPAAATASFSALVETVVELLRRARLLAPNKAPAFGPAPTSQAGKGDGQRLGTPPAAGQSAPEPAGESPLPAAGGAVAESDRQP